MAHDYYKHTTIQLDVHLKHDTEVRVSAKHFDADERQHDFYTLRLETDGVGVVYYACNSQQLVTMLEQALEAMQKTIADGSVSQGTDIDYAHRIKL